MISCSGMPVRCTRRMTVLAGTRERTNASASASIVCPASAPSAPICRRRPAALSPRPGRPDAASPYSSSVSSVDEVLTLLHSNRAQRHGLVDLSAGEQGCRRPPLQAVPLMRALPIVEAQVGLQIALQLRDARIVRPAEGDPPQLAQDRPLQAFDEAIGPRMARFGTAMLDPQLATGGQEASIGLRPPIGQDGADVLARVPVGGYHAGPQERGRRVEAARSASTFGFATEVGKHGLPWGGGSVVHTGFI